MRRAWIAVVVGAFGLGMAWVTASSPVEAAAGRATAAVSMGDSFISGEGGRWSGNSLDPTGDRDGTDRAAYRCGTLGCRYDAGRVYGDTAANHCHRSDVAPVLNVLGVDLRLNLACSGARARHIWRSSRGGESFRGEPPQSDQLAAIARRLDVELIVLTVSANDLGFTGHVVDCTLAWATSTPSHPRYCHDREQAEVEAGLPRARGGLAKAVDEIRAVMAGAGYGARDYRLLIMGYSSPIPHGREMRFPAWGWSRMTRGGCPFWNADADWANDGITPTMVAAMRDVAARRGAEFLDVQPALDGHRVCDRAAATAGSTGPTEANSEWVRRLVPGCCAGSVQESLHPNAYGQRALGRCIELAFEREPGGEWACRATPGAGIAAITLSPAR
jgi:GDSL-like Lipase/Acylhydrolase family